MKKLTALIVACTMALATVCWARGGGGFSGGHSSSFSSGRSSSFSSSSRSSSFSSSSRSSSTSSSSSSSSSRGSSFTPSSRGSFGSTSTSRNGAFGTSSSGSFGNGSSTSRSTPYVATNREVLSSSSSVVYASPSRSVPIYYYYYPSPFYGSGFNFYEYYFWTHMFGDHSHCYHHNGGQEVKRVCTLDKECFSGEKCSITPPKTAGSCTIKSW